jgi:hypothetical protein
VYCKHLKLKVMALDRSIGSQGLEQGGPNLGNDYSRDITRERQSEKPTTIVVPHDKERVEEEAQKEREKRNTETH